MGTEAGGMTREEAMVKLLAVGELRLQDLYVICGWHPAEVRSVLFDLVLGDQVRCVSLRGERWYRVDPTTVATAGSAKGAARCA